MSVRQLPEELARKAEVELNETPERVQDGITNIRGWIIKQPHIRARIDDQWLLNFLRCSKFSTQRAKERIDYYYTLKTLVPEYFINKDPFLPEIQDILTRGFTLPLPNITQPDGPLLVLFRWNVGDPSVNSYTNVIKVVTMILDILLLENDNVSVAGVVALEDFTDYPLSYVFQQTPTVCKKVALSLQNGHPIRLKGAYIFNSPSFIAHLYNAFKPFLSEKLQKRVSFYSGKDINKFHEKVSLNVLPKQYGGSGECIHELTANWKKKVESYSEWFKEDDRYCTDESRRLGKPKTTADIFGVEGSFRKLTVD